jgi:2-keto-4-pentenoate hydratase/2-oxohepta-3-ene-1,7-dioic acid hydratase in catechol pathway
MKIICVGRNYGAHAQELGNAIPEEPVIFLKPASALLAPSAPIALPPHLGSIHYETEVVFRVGKRLYQANQRSVMDALDGATLGLDLTARDLQTELKRKGLPWEKSKAFDGSAVLGSHFIPMPEDPNALPFVLYRNGQLAQKSNTAQMLFKLPFLLAHISQYFTLEPEDLLFTGTPEGVGPLAPGDELIGELNGERLLQVAVLKG